MLDPTLDVVFKMLLAGPESTDVLIALLTAVLKPPAPIDGVEVLNPELPREAVEDRGVVLDIRVRLGSGVQLDLEMQAEKRPWFRRRALYYWARMFGSQLERGDTYFALRPVVSILFLDYQELPSARLHSVFRLLELHDHSVFSDALEIHAIELPKLRNMVDAEKKMEGKLVDWARFFAARTPQDLEAVAMSDPMIDKAKGLLEKLSADPAAQERARERELALRTYHLELTGAREEGREEGREMGLGPLIHLFQRRLGRPLADNERATLYARMDTLGPDRLGDVVLDLTPEALNTWLTDPAAR